jgi:hypothetical protein
LSLSHGRFCPPLPPLLSVTLRHDQPLTAEVRLRYRTSPCGIKWHRYRFLSQYFGHPLSVSQHQCAILVFILILLLSERQAGKGWEPSDKAEFFRISGQHWTEHCFNLLWGFERLNGGMQEISGVQLTSEVAYLSRQQSDNTSTTGAFRKRRTALHYGCKLGYRNSITVKGRQLRLCLPLYPDPSLRT